MTNHGRTDVLWLSESQPSPKLTEEFNHRNLQLMAVEPGDIPDRIALARAIILPYSAGCRETAQEVLQSNRLLDQGVMVAVLHPEADAMQAQKDFTGMMGGSRDRVRLVTDSPPHLIAQKVADYDPGPPENMGTEIIGTDIPTLQLLLRRAFSDSDKVELESLTVGTEALAFRAEVTGATKWAAPSPLPYFVKYAPVYRIDKELKNYRRYVGSYIPFNHRPNLVYERCLMGEANGLLVGDFVENSEPLGQAVSRGTVHSTIHSLFQSALRGWRRQAFHDPEQQFAVERVASIYDSLQRDCRLELFRSQIAKPIDNLSAALGATMTCQDLVAQVRQFPRVRHLRGLIHRDLHANNVHAHASDAILLDFYAASFGPLLYDAALLEVSFAFELDYGEGDDDQWTHAIAELYSDRAIKHPLSPRTYRGAYAGLMDAMQEIRLYAQGLQLEEGSYAQALVIALLRVASRPAMMQKHPTRSAYALVTAERLLRTMGSGDGDEGNCV